MIFNQTHSVQTVSQLTTTIKDQLEGNFRFVAVSGEISNLKTPYSGHSYFTLKDENAQIRAVLFKGQKRYLSEALRDGQQIICRGRVTVYEPRGDYQLIVDTIDQHGVGLLQMKFAALKKKLAEQGFFDREHKQPIPHFPQNIVVISSATGAAIHDFLKICAIRKSSTTIQIYPVPVQGDQAPGAVSHAIEMINRKSSCDLIVLCRGGGSIEDLWAFNEEEVAQAIFHSRIPIVTGIGHETDTTIADLCADMRCPTPTGVAEQIIPDNILLAKELNILNQRLKRSLRRMTDLASQKLLMRCQQLSTFHNRIESLSLRLDPKIERVQRAAQQMVALRQEKLNNLSLRLHHQAPLTQIAHKKEVLSQLQRNMTQQMNNYLRNYEERLALAMTLLQGVSPLSTLSRGYAIVQKFDKFGRPNVAITDAGQVEPGERLNVKLNRGDLTCEVLTREGDS